jgi:hypothetical protein
LVDDRPLLLRFVYLRVIKVLRDWFAFSQLFKYCNKSSTRLKYVLIINRIDAKYVTALPPNELIDNGPIRKQRRNELFRPGSNNVSRLAIGVLAVCEPLWRFFQFEFFISE